jgi:hypothetical protein
MTTRGSDMRMRASATALLLPAGQLRGITVAEPVHAHEREDVAGLFEPFAAVLRVFHDAHDVLTGRHIGKQRGVLEHVSRFALLRRNVDALVRIEQGYAVQNDGALGGGDDAGDAFERHALAAAGGAQDADDLAAGVETESSLKRARFS